MGSTMEAKAHEAVMEAENTESDYPVSNGELQIDELIGKGLNFDELIGKGLNFDEWVSLISKIETTYPDDIEKICVVYDSFLSEFPLCHGYWRRYAHHKIRLCTVNEVVEVFERAVQSATYVVGVWVDYCAFSMSVFEDPSDIRRLFKRGMSYVGKDYLCHALWDQYIQFEVTQQQWGLLARIYVEALRFPTKKLHSYYASFKKLAALCNKDSDGQNNCKVFTQLDSPTLDEVPKSYTNSELSSVVEELFDPSISLARSKTLLKKYVFIGEHLYQEASQRDKKISIFEANIRRTYFHAKPLDTKQLENWHHYLDFVEIQGDFDWVVRLYERCLIPCVLYPEFWMRYVEFTETKGGREIANYALNRATQVFLKRSPAVHLFSARFKELQGDVIGAHSALLHCSAAESDPKFVEKVVIKANMERRLRNFASASKIFEEAIEAAAETKNLHNLPSLYIHFSRLKHTITDDVDAARDVLIDGIKHLPDSMSLLEELINFATMNGGKRHIDVLDSIIDSATSPDSDVACCLDYEDAEAVSSLYLKFVDLCGTIHDLRKAWNRHLRLFPLKIRTLFNEKPITNSEPLDFSKAGRETTHDAKPQQPPSGDCSPEYLKESPTVDSRSGHSSPNSISEHISANESHDIQLEQAPMNEFELREPDNIGGQEREEFPSNDVTDEPRKDSSATNMLSSVDIVSSEVPEQDISEDIVTKSEPDLNDIHQDVDHDMKLLSVESLSLHPIPEDDTTTVSDVNPFVSPSTSDEAPLETCNMDESNSQTNHHSNVEDACLSIQRKTKASESPPIETEVVNSSTSVNHQSSIPSEPPQMPMNSGHETQHQINNSGKVHRESNFGPRRHLQRRSFQQRQSQVSPQNPQPESGGPMQIQMGSRAQPPPNPWPLQNMPQQSYPSLPQTIQGVIGDHGMQNSQAYDQNWQFYYYQQQLLLQQQQQKQQPHYYQQQNVGPQQQLEHQMPFRQQYFQQLAYQQQQYSQQQFYQQPQQQQHQFYAQQVVPQQSRQSQMSVSQSKSQNSCLEVNGTNQLGGSEPSPLVVVSQERVTPNTSGTRGLDNVNTATRTPQKP